jgi:hypothetical protein
MAPPPAYHDLVFSLGPNCKNSWNLRSYFGVERAFPFDWWITPARSMLAMLEPGFRFHVAPDDLLITPPAADGGNSVYNRRLHLLHHHDFPRRDNRVEGIAPEQLAQVNAKYTALFARLHADIAAARAPLAVLNGSSSGWAEDITGAGLMNRELNGYVRPAELVRGIRDRLGGKLRVVIVAIGPERMETFEGGVLIARPDRRRREPQRTAPSYAEPVHVFRECYEALGLAPVSLPVAAPAP